MAERAAKQLELNKSELPNSITEVIATLTRAGFDAYIVGGGVRDTLLGLRPKDFDAVTDAKPHEIKDVFGKRCRIIGRRFKLAHVYSGRELIEVATFRGPPTSKGNTNQEGMILRDNVWGDIKQDFSRRDFSINALYYQPLKGVVHDFCDALDDIDNKIIRLLGEASVRIEEDPVRLLRALRFKAKLGFEFDKALAEQFHESNWALLEQISPHRLYDETQKMFTGGYLVPLLPLLFESGAIDSLVIYPPSEPSALVQQVAINTDKRIAAGKSINPAFFYAALLWENYLHQLEKAKKRNMPFAEAQMHAAGKVIDRQRIKTAIPKFAEQFIRDIWILQPKLSAPRNKQIEQLAEHPRFRAAFDFLLLREQCDDAAHPLSESTNEMGVWWQTYQTLSEQEKQQAIDDFDESIRRGSYKKRQRSRGRNRQNSDSKSLDTSTAKQQNTGDSTAKAEPKQPTVPDSSNVPARRRRAKSQSTADKHKNSRHNDQQPQQDTAELAQLQKLSLASHDDQSKCQSKQQPAHYPEPLFVVEHEKVVPPLKKQLPEASKGSSKHSQKAEQRKAVDSADKKAPVKKSVESSHSTSDTNGKPAQTIAKTPALVSINNAPIPHKRRRQRVTTDNSSTDNSGADTSPAVPKDQAAVKYPKKAPKPAKSSPSATSNAAASKATDNKGPIPSKRRRRQPSSNA